MIAVVQVCIQDLTKTALDCATLVEMSFMNEMDIAFPDAEIRGFETALCASDATVCRAGLFTD